MADTVETAIYRLDLDQAAYVAKADAVAKADQKMVSGAEAVTVSQEKVGRATRTTADSVARLEARIDPVVRAEQAHQRQLELVSRALEEGAIDQARYGQALQRVEANYVRARANAQRMTGTLVEGGRSSRAFGSSIQQAGYQVGDFAVQIASGQSPVRAFIQQGSQLAGAFGPWGAILGAGIAVVGALGGSLIKFGQDAKDATRAQDAFTKAVEASNAVLDSAAEKARRAGEEQRKAAVAAAEAALEDLRTQRRNLQKDIDALEKTVLGADRTAVLGGARGVGREAALRELQKTNDELLRLYGNAFDLQKQIDEVGARLGRLSDARISGPEAAERRETLEWVRKIRDGLRDGLMTARVETVKWIAELEAAAGKAGETAIGAVERVRTEQLAELAKRTRGGLVEPEEAVRARLAIEKRAAVEIAAIRDKQDKELEAAEERRMQAAEREQAAAQKREVALAQFITGLEQAGALEGETAEQREVSRALIEAQNKLLDEQGEKVRDLTEIEAERIEAAVRARQAEREAREEAEKARKEAEARAEEQRRILEEPFLQAARNLQSLFADTFERIFEGGIDSFSDLASAIKRIFIRLAAEIAALLVFRPILGSVLGGFGLGGGASAAGLGGIQFGRSAAPGLGDVLGLGRGLGSLSDLANGTLGGFGALNRFGAQIGFGVPGLPGSLTSATLGSVLGAAGIGFTAGGLISSLIGGNTTFGSIGGGLGAALGQAFIPIPGVGAIIGGLAGSLLGGLLGGKKKKPAAQLLTAPLGAGPELFEDSVSLASPFGVVGLSRPGSRKVDADFARQVTRAIVQIDELLAAALTETETAAAGQRLQETEAIREKFKKFDNEMFALVADRIENVFEALDIPEAARFDIDAISPSQENVDVLTQAAATLLAERRAILDIVEGFGKTPKPATEAAVAIAAVNEQFDALAKGIEKFELGVDAAIQATERARALRRLATDFDTSIEKAILAIVDPGKLAFDELARAQYQQRQDAEKLGADLVQLERLHLLQRQELLKEAAAEEQRAIEASLAAQVAAAEAAREEWGRLRDLIRDTRLGLLTDPTLSPLSLEARRAEAERQFDALTREATLGNAGAVERLPDAARTFLEASQQFFASSPGFVSDFDKVQQSLANTETTAERQIRIAEAQLVELQRIAAERSLASAAAVGAAAGVATAGAIDYLREAADRAGIPASVDPAAVAHFRTLQGREVGFAAGGSGIVRGPAGNDNLGLPGLRVEAGELVDVTTPSAVERLMTEQRRTTARLKVIAEALGEHGGGQVDLLRRLLLLSADIGDSQSKQLDAIGEGVADLARRLGMAA